MSQPSSEIEPFRVVYSELCREDTRRLLERARTTGRFAELADAVREINRRLEWIPLDFGEPLRDLASLGIREFIGVIPPLVVLYGVDESRRLVHVALPFRLLPNADL